MVSGANPFENPQIAQRYEDWYAGRGRKADVCEQRLLRNLLGGFHDIQSAVDIGAGTGHFTRFFSVCDLNAVGLDSSNAMLTEAKRLGPEHYVVGDAGALPFPDQCFDVVALVATLEFLPDARSALIEAVRVARHGLLLGVLNRLSITAVRRRLRNDAVWRAARFFAPGELHSLVSSAAGSRLSGLKWRTTLWPLPFIPDLHLPFGGFIGLAASLDG
jgi:ubiquinone/menaquinone biosynthesis C-methylase UbiE